MSLIHRGGTRPAGALPGSLVAASLYAVLAAAALVWVDGLPTAVRLPLALPLLILVPGHAVVSALFPPAGGSVPSRARFSRLERGVLAVIVSVAVVPMVALLVAVVAGVDPGLILGGLAAVTVIGAALAMARLPPSDEWPAMADGREPWLRRLTRGLRSGLTDGVTLFTVAIVAFLLAASVSAAIAGDTDDAPRTEFYFADGTVPAGDAAAAPGTPAGVGVFDLRIEHFRPRPQRFTVVVYRGRAGTGDLTAGAWTALDRSTIDVAPGETGTVTYRLDRTGWDGNTTVLFGLFRGDVAASSDPGAAHRLLEYTADGAP